MGVCTRGANLYKRNSFKRTCLLHCNAIARLQLSHVNMKYFMFCFNMDKLPFSPSLCWIYVAWERKVTLIKSSLDTIPNMPIRVFEAFITLFNIRCMFLFIINNTSSILPFTTTSNLQFVKIQHYGIFLIHVSHSSKLYTTMETSLCQVCILFIQVLISTCMAFQISITRVSMHSLLIIFIHLNKFIWLNNVVFWLNSFLNMWHFNKS